MAEPVRLVAVLGFSHWRGQGLHSICAERLTAAEALADGAAAVLLSGDVEAEPMRAAWRGPTVPLLTDEVSRTTAGNAQAVAAVARELGATEVVAVTSAWHRPRARLLLRAALDPDVELEVVSPAARRPPRLLARELACFAVLPLQLRRARRAAPGTAPLWSGSTEAPPTE